MPRLGWYLDKIRRGERVNRSGFLKAWQSVAPLSQIGSMLDMDVPPGSPYRITHDTNFQSMCARHGAGSDLTNRVTAARTGQSHRVGVSSGMLVIRSIAEPHPIVALIPPVGPAVMPRAQAQRALIVENLEVFLAIGALEAFIVKKTTFPLVGLAGVDIIFGAGNAITKSINWPFLRGYEHTYWLPDLDVGGLRIVAAALKALGENKIGCVVPTGLERWLERPGEALSGEECDALHELARSHPALQQTCMALLSAGKKIEQEVYLDEVEMDASFDDDN